MTELKSKYEFIALAGLILSSPAAAKGLEGLTPQNIAQASVSAEAKSTQVSTNHGVGIATSWGLARAYKGGEDWNATAMSDVSVTYHLHQIGQINVDALFRYAPIYVRPRVKIDGTEREFSGVLDGYWFGAIGRMTVANIKTYASAEAGAQFVYLKDDIGLVDPKAPEENGFGLNLGGGANWEPIPGLHLGPKLVLGFGTFSTFQIAAQAEFLF